MNRFVAASLTLFALFLFGCSSGESETPSPKTTEEATLLETTESSSPTVESSVPEEEDTPTSFPNYIGRSYDEVITELEEYGVRIIKTEKESIEPAGEIMSQVPEGGADFDTKIELVVAIRPAGVPDVSNYSFGEAKRVLEELDFVVVEVPVIDASKSDGMIVSQEPAPGSKNAGKVTLTVARQPVTYGLPDIEHLEAQDLGNSHSLELEGTFQSNGEVYSRGASVNFYGTDPAVLSFNLSYDFLDMTGTIGLSDDSPKGAKVKVEVTGDDRELFSGTVGFRETLPFKANVSDVLRLEIRIAPTDGDAKVILGDWRLRGFSER